MRDSSIRDSVTELMLLSVMGPVDPALLLTANEECCSGEWRTIVTG